MKEVEIVDVLQAQHYRQVCSTRTEPPPMSRCPMIRPRRTIRQESGVDDGGRVRRSTSMSTKSPSLCSAAAPLTTFLQFPSSEWSCVLALRRRSVPELQLQVGAALGLALKLLLRALLGLRRPSSATYRGSRATADAQSSWGKGR